MGQTAATDVCNNNILEDNIYSLKMLPVSEKPSIVLKLTACKSLTG